MIGPCCIAAEWAAILRSQPLDAVQGNLLDGGH